MFTGGAGFLILTHGQLTEHAIGRLQPFPRLHPQHRQQRAVRPQCRREIWAMWRMAWVRSLIH